MNLQNRTLQRSEVKRLDLQLKLEHLRNVVSKAYGSQCLFPRIRQAHQQSSSPSSLRLQSISEVVSYLNTQEERQIHGQNIDLQRVVGKMLSKKASKTKLSRMKKKGKQSIQMIENNLPLKQIEGGFMLKIRQESSRSMMPPRPVEQEPQPKQNKEQLIKGMLKHFAPSRLKFQKSFVGRVKKCAKYIEEMDVGRIPKIRRSIFNAEMGKHDDLGLRVQLDEQSSQKIKQIQKLNQNLELIQQSIGRRNRSNILVDLFLDDVRQYKATKMALANG